MEARDDVFDKQARICVFGLMAIVGFRVCGLGGVSGMFGVSVRVVSSVR